MESELTDLFLKTLLFSDDVSPTDQPSKKFVEAAALDHALRKSPLNDFSWDEQVSVGLATPLEKSSADPSKASSRRGMIRLEKVFDSETGEPLWVDGYDSEGNLKFSKILV